MAATTITVEATLQPDGQTLQLDRKVTLPPGRVTVTVQPAAARSGRPLAEVLEWIDRELEHQGRKRMTEEEMAAEIARMRADEDEYEERWRQIWAQTNPGPGKTDQP